MYAGAVGAGLPREPMCPISSIVPAELVRTPGGNDGGRKSFPSIAIIKPINMQPRSAGVRKTPITGSITALATPTIGKETERCRNNVTAADLIRNPAR